MVVCDIKIIVGLYFEINIMFEIFKCCDWLKGVNFMLLCFMVRFGVNYKLIVFIILVCRIVNICK